MGLTVHYSLSLPATKTEKEVVEMVKKLHSFCLDQPFKKVDKEVKIFQGDNCNFDKVDKDDPHRWLLIQSCNYVNYQDTYSGITQKIKEGDYSHSSIGVNAKKIIGFSTWAGSGCEDSNFGMCLYPKTIKVKSRHTGLEYRLKVQNADRWSWHSFCKTQYANNPTFGGIQNFLRCHLLVIKTLDKAKELGFEVSVSDEGDYFTKRDIGELAKEVCSWDNFIAGMAGIMKDVAEANGEKLEAAILNRQDFEHLEAKGQEHIKAGTKEVMEGIAKTIQIVQTPNLN